MNEQPIIQPAVGQGNTTVPILEPTKVPESKEEKEKNAERERLLEDPQVQLFLQYYYDKTEKETFGNRVKSYIKAYNFDPVKQYWSAASLSSRLYKKVKSSAQEYLEESGWGIETLLELNKQKAVSTNNARYLDMLYEMGDYKKAVGVTNNNQFNILTLDKEKADKFTNKLLELIENE
jgi:hypothetical protein